MYCGGGEVLRGWRHSSNKRYGGAVTMGGEGTAKAGMDALCLIRVGVRATIKAPKLHSPRSALHHRSACTPQHLVEYLHPRNA